MIKGEVAYCLLCVYFFYLICQMQCLLNPISHTLLSASLFMQHWNYIKVSTVVLRLSYLIRSMSNTELISFLISCEMAVPVSLLDVYSVC